MLNRARLPRRAFRIDAELCAFDRAQKIGAGIPIPVVGWKPAKAKQESADATFGAIAKGDNDKAAYERILRERGCMFRE